MPIWKSKSCRWPILAFSLAGALGALDGAIAQVPLEGPVPAGAARVQGQEPEPEQELYLEVTLNRVATGRLWRFVRKPDGLHASAETLREIGIKWPPGAASAGLVALSRIKGLDLVYDGPRQQVALTATLDLLDRPRTQIDAAQEERARVDPASRAPGLIVNYDLYGQQTGGVGSLSGFTETRLFGLGPGIWSNTMVTRTGNGAGGLPEHSNIRLDTSWQRSFPDQMMTLTVGDVTTGALSWSRASRIGGVRLSRNFSLQPYRVTTPLSTFQGSAVLPSTVDLFVNGLKQSSQMVQPGEFQLSGIPTLGGMGQAQMVITDINGQRRVVNFDLYGAPQLLEEGLTDWSLDLGSIRRDYGLRSFSYGDLLASASARHGWSSRTTLEAHAEAGPRAWQVGVGGVWRVGEQAGVVNGSLAASASRKQGVAGGEQSGVQWGLGYQWNSRRLTASLSTLRRQAGFTDVAAQPGELLSRGSDSVYLGVSGSWGQVGANYIRQQYFNTPAERFAGLSWSYQLGSSAMLSFSVNRSLDNPSGSSMYLSWSMPLERNLMVSAAARSRGDAQSLVLDAARSAPSDVGGWGWRVQAGAGDGASALAQVSQLGRFGQWSAGVSRFGAQNGAASSRTVYGSANGGLVLMQGQVQALRRVDDGFALVSTDGVAGVPVRLENRIVGETDARGMLFVTQLNSYQKNQLAIDTLELPVDMRIERSSLIAVPDGRSGMLVRFPLRRILAVELSLRDTQGEWLPAGSPVWLEAPASGAAPAMSSAAPSPATTFVGFDGMVYLEDPAPGAVLRVQLPAGTCRVLLPLPSQSSGLVDLGVLPCR